MEEKVIRAQKGLFPKTKKETHHRTEDTLGVFIVLIAFALVTALPAQAAQAERWLILPFKSVGVSQNTATVFQNLLKQKLTGHADHEALVSEGAGPCEDSPCAGRQATTAGTDWAIYGDLSALG